MKRPTVISKVLSPNDVGETGGHQAGFLIPKSNGALWFFPQLSDSVKNPRCELYFEDEVCHNWKLSFIYYNNKYYGGTRDEYRLTGLTKYFRQNGLESGDTITLSRNDDEEYQIRYSRSSPSNIVVQTGADGTSIKKLIVSDAWRVIEY